MRHGDLSNKGGIKIAFRVEDTLLKKSNTNPVAEFTRKFNRMYSYEVDMSVLSIIHRLYVNTDYNLVMVIDNNNKDKKVVREVLRRVPFCEEVYVNSTRLSEIEIQLLSKEWEYYIDDNDIRRSGISSSAAVSLKELLETCLRV